MPPADPTPDPPTDAARPPTVLVVHHTVSPALAELVDAVVAGVRHPDLEGAVRAEVRPALSATAHDLLSARGLVVVTPVNIGYMAGAVKHFFDTVYYPCLTSTTGLPYGLVVHGNSDVTGGVRSVETVATGMGWRRVVDPLEVVGPPGREVLDACVDLGGTVAVQAEGALS